MRKHYPDDLTGENPVNIAEGSLSTSTYPNRFNLVVPFEGPFFRNGMELKDTDGNQLFEGIDYYLALYYADGAHAANAQIFGGIMLLTKTEITYKVQVIGSAYSVPESDIGKFLVNPELTEPRNIDWSSLMRYQLPIMAIDPPGDLDEAIARDEVMAAINNIRLKVEAKAGQMDAEIEQTLEALSRSAKKIYLDQLLQHHKTPHQHKYTPADVGALSVDGVATNAIKAFSKTLSELVAILVEHKISQRVVDTLIDDTMGQVFGRFKAVSGDELVYSTANGKAALRFTNGKILLTGTEAVVELAADSDNNDRGIGVSSRAGYNELFVPSKGGAAGAKDVRPIYNGAFLITPSSVSIYLYPPLNSNAQPTFQSTPTVRMGGSGSANSPLNLTANPVSATQTDEGMFRLTDNVETIAPNFALSQKGINDLLLKLNNYVDETFKVNGASFGPTQTVNLTALSFGLDKVDNTAPADKPVHQPFRDALSQKALKVHTHVPSDLDNVPIASDTVSGLAYLYTLLDTTSDKAATAKLGYQLKLDIDAAEDKANNLLPSWVASGTYYGDSGFLPIPTMGQYKGTSSVIDSNHNAVMLEQDSRLYVLRNGHEGYTASERVYYWYRDIDRDTSIPQDTFQATAVQYKPAGMALKYPGVEMQRVWVNGDDCAIFLGTDALYYLVEFGGTLDATKHVNITRVSLAAIIFGGSAQSLAPTPATDYVHQVNGKFYLTKSVLANGDFYTALWSLEKSELSKAAAVFTVVPITGKHSDGQVGRFATVGTKSQDASTTNLYYITPAALAKYTVGLNLVHSSRRNWLYGKEGSKIRCRANVSMWIASSSDSMGNRWQVSFVIDVDAKTATLDNDFLPIKIDVNAVTGNGGNYFTYNAYGDLYGNMILSTQLNSRGWIDYLGNDNNNTDNRHGRVSLEGLTPFAACRWDVPLPNLMGSTMLVNGAYGSVYAYRMRGLVQLGNAVKKALLRRTDSSSTIIAAYDPAGSYNFPGYGGFGPSNDRQTIQDGDYNLLSRCAYVFDGGNNYLNGATFSAPGTSPYKNINGNPVMHSATIAISSAQWTDFQSMLTTRISLWGTSGLVWKSARLNLMDIGGQNVCIATATFGKTEADGITYVYFYYFRIPMTFANGVVTLNYSGVSEIGREEKINISAVAFNDGIDAWQPRLLKRADGWIIRPRHHGHIQTIGGGGSHVITLTCDTNWANWTVERASVNPAYGESDVVHIPETNEVLAAGWIANGAYYGGQAFSNNSRDWKTGTSRQVILFGPQLAEGLILYFTQPVRFFAEGKEGMVPVSSFDFKALFPDSYQNQTFYFYAIINAFGNPGYMVSQNMMADTTTRLYIGYAKTSTNAIVETNINRVKRLGRVGALLVHADNPYAHDYLEGGTLSKSIYSVMENMGTIDSFAFPSFKDIYNNWYRFSHYLNVQAQPANESELTAWRYIDADDVVECTINSATFVGFISDELVGDYDFNTVITSNDGDDDGVTLVLAALKKEDSSAGREQTLCLALSNTTTQTHVDVSSFVQLKENYCQPTSKLIATVDEGTGAAGGWNLCYAHVLVQRRGNKLYIAVERGKLPTSGDRDTNIRAIVSAKSSLSLSQLRNSSTYKYAEVDLAEVAPTFARSCRFGYGAISQNATRFWNIQRPGADLSKAYATAAALDVANGLAGNYDPSVSRRSTSSSVINWTAFGNKAFKLWPRVAASPNTRGTPVAQTICPVGVNNMAAGQAWVTRLDFVAPAASLTMSIDVDDSVDVYLNGSKQGTVSAGTATALTLNGASVGTANVLALVVKEAPGNTPCYLAFTLSNGSTVIATSSLNMAWSYLADPANLDSVQGVKYVRQETINVPAGKDYTLAIRASQTPNVPVQYFIEDSGGSGARTVNVFYDCSVPVTFDVMIHDSTLSA